MWSGPRNISTAMMRSWENRQDTMVVDEPLYGPYLYQTGKKHVAYEQIIEIQGKQYQPIIKELTEAKVPADIKIYYQKHMAHHLLPDLDLSWVKKLSNVFLIRDPQYVLQSYLKKEPQATPEDLGYPQLLKIFNIVRDEFGITPAVFDSKDILMNPESMLRKMCEYLKINFDINMLHWAKGYRDSDGIWASHWYNRVIESTGFSEYKSKQIKLSAEEKKVAEACEPYYLELLQYKITVIT
jgi:hypothetical protein